MTQRNKYRVCGQPHCPTIVQGTTRCPQHKTKDTNRPTAHQRGYNTQWKKTRKQYLQQHPNCCVIGCTRKATDVDHIQGRGPLAPDGHQHNQLQPLCHQHHSQKTASTTHNNKQPRVGVPPTNQTPHRP